MLGLLLLVLSVSNIPDTVGIIKDRFTYNTAAIKESIGGCTRLTARNYYNHRGPLTVVWRKNMRIIDNIHDDRITMIGKYNITLSITSLRRSDFAFYSATLQSRSSNFPRVPVIETTNFWINVKGCANNEKENNAISKTSCETLCERVCEEGWRYVPGSDGKCVKYIGQPKSWIEANDDCQRRSGELVTISDKEENKFIASLLLTGEGSWIGLNDQRLENRYEWNFSPKRKVSFTTWAEGEPNNYNRGCNIENCVSMRKGTGKWNDLICGAYNSYVCQLDSGKGQKSWNCTGRKCYKYFHDYFNWFDALENCRRIGAKLATIDSPAENRLVSELIEGVKGNPKHTAWIGLNDIWEAGLYSWNNYKGDLWEARYLNWEFGEPNDKFMAPFADPCKGEDCVQLKSTSGNPTWQDRSCSTPLPYICEITRERGYTIGGIIGMVIGCVILLGMIGGAAHVSYVNRKRTAVKDIIKQAYTDDYLPQ